MTAASFARAQEKAGLTREEFWLLNRFRYFPGTVAPGDFLTFGPYASVSTYEQQLESLVAKKFAEAVDTGRYRSAEAGRKLVDQLYRDYFAAIARHDRLNEADVQRLGALADRVVALPGAAAGCSRAHHECRPQRLPGNHARLGVCRAACHRAGGLSRRCAHRRVARRRLERAAHRREHGAVQGRAAAAATISCARQWRS